MTRRIILHYCEPGAAPDIITDSVGDVEVFHYCPWATGDEMYRTSPEHVERDTAKVDALLSKHRIGQLGDRPGVENEIADMLGVERPHDLPSGPRLAVDNGKREP
jgi:hypothetical protein